MIDLIELIESRRSINGHFNGHQRPHRHNEPSGASVPTLDVEQLHAELRRAVRGEVRSEQAYRAMYSTEASNYRQIPIAVVLPHDASDVERAVEVCRRFDAPIVSRGGGTALAGQTCNVAVVLDFSKYMHHLIALDPERRTARVEPGCILDDLRNQAEKHHLTFGPDPATHERNTLGGMIGNNSCGMHAQMAGKVEENIEELEILTYDGLRMRVGATSEEELESIIAQGGRRGEIYAALKALRDRYADAIRARFPDIPRRVSGYPLQELLPENGFNVARALVGTESTCVTVLEATCRLIPSPPVRVLVLFGFGDIGTAGDNVAFCNTHQPLALEGLDESMFRYMNEKHISTKSREMFPEGNAWLIVEFGGDTRKQARAKAKRLVDAFSKRSNPPTSKIFDDRAEEKLLWKVRESGLGSTSKIPGERDFYPGWEDSAVKPEQIGAYVRDFQELLTRYGYAASLYGHFGQGCLHCSINFDLFTTEGIATYRRFVTEAAHLVVTYGGSLSGEHGDGQARGELLSIMYGDELVGAFEEFKAIWDPRKRMNPGKVVHPRKLDEDLRWGAQYEPWEPKTHFHFPEDNGSFAYAANRCVGTGACRKHDVGTMCPSYMATREEAYSTRGRARLLFEMLQGDPIRDGWADETVRDSLDLCLACKGCKSECPVNVDMATYKAEFFSHYYEQHRRPLSAYAFGLMPWWANVASLLPTLANAATHMPLVRELAKKVVGIAPQRSIPLFAPQTFRTWFSRRQTPLQSTRRVVLWPDTWNDHFHPQTLQAAVYVLEDAGFQVLVPPPRMCCGRPLYDWGMLDLARTLLRQNLQALRDEVRAGTCIVGLEPSCISVFRDEMNNLLGTDVDAVRLSEQTYLLGEFLARKAPEYRPPPLERQAIVHEHCHHKSILDKESDRKLFDALGLRSEFLDSGCCGMAGAFGFEERHYRVSIGVGERVLLPAVRGAQEQSLIVADGFSCREQIAQTTNRLALHPAQVLQMAIDQRDGRARVQAGENFPELHYMPDRRSEEKKAEQHGTWLALAALGAAGALGVRRLLLGSHAAREEH